jgi:hypothetical protein
MGMHCGSAAVVKEDFGFSAQLITLLGAFNSACQKRSAADSIDLSVSHAHQMIAEL